jgi:membrane-associated phospholipid phosphatase
VAYSRVHTGVHFPGDVVVGALIGMTVGEIAPRVVDLLAKNSGVIRRLVG